MLRVVGLTRLAVLCVGSMILVSGSAAGQDFIPPVDDNERGSFWIGLDGFTARLGLELAGDRQAVLGVTLDLGYLGSERLRLRSFGEVGFADENDIYVFGADLIYRFARDRDVAIPYFGLGAGVFGSETCGEAVDCPEVWPILTVGLELRLQSRINWLIEYRAEDSFGRHRVFVGLATRRGG